MTAEEITPATLVEIIFDAPRRASLFAALQKEQGSHLPVINRICEVAPHCLATDRDLERVTEILLKQENGEQILDWIVFHPSMPEHVLYKLLDMDRCIDSLGHRRGPKPLLERLASQRRYSEAITTLALDYYAGSDTSPEAFAAFVREYKDDYMLRYNLRRSPKLTEEKKQIALAIVGERETD